MKNEIQPQLLCFCVIYLAWTLCMCLSISINQVGFTPIRVSFVWGL